MSLECLGAGWRSYLEAEFKAFELEEPSLEPLAELLDQVVVWNRRHNLTAARTAQELVDLYFADALCLWRAEREPQPGASPEHWVEVGSGGGAPGLTLALLMQGQRLSLIEPRDKRVAFLRSMVGRFGLRQASVLRKRSDELPNAFAEMAFARATLPPPAWLKEGGRLATRRVWLLLALEAPPVHEGWELTQELKYRWPLTGFERRLVLYEPTDAPRD